MAKVLLLILKNSSQYLQLIASTGTFMSVVYTLNRMDKLNKFFLLSAVQPLDQQHSHILGYLQLIKHQLFNIIGAKYNAH
jgi:hypothetical protein